MASDKGHKQIECVGQQDLEG